MCSSLHIGVMTSLLVVMSMALPIYTKNFFYRLYMPVTTRIYLLGINCSFCSIVHL
ncbi:hypothetical protein C2G38_278234 [Gigaspora rosea]|uniref:Uncharacterized protein n=1 Tax=Gigaspora rosea TaxID=44941 RepID=A0A397UGB4_9GLOM|nr:hypothetical protein C2G38_278234 [Gigaspora rosea]